MTVFLDTNVLVYAFDRSEPTKRAAAQQLLERSNVDFVTSAQVLSEFYVTTTRKLTPPLSHADAVRAIEHLSKLPIVAIDARLVREAAEMSDRESLSLWDAQIVQAAARAGCDEVLTEDLNDGQTIAGVAIRNPLQ
jgi:predicted nucleic acid-binding protein